MSHPHSVTSNSAVTHCTASNQAESTFPAPAIAQKLPGRLALQRFLNQPIEHRQQIAAILLQAQPHAPHISAGLDQLNHVQQVLAAHGSELRGDYRSASAMNSKVA